MDAYFEKTILKAQNVLGTKENWDKVLNLIPDAGIQLNRIQNHSFLEIRMNLDAFFSKNAHLNSVEKWKVVCDELRHPKKVILIIK